MGKKRSKLDNFLYTQVFNFDQMHFLKNMLALVELDQLPELQGYVFWWIGRTDLLLKNCANSELYFVIQLGFKTV